VSLIRLRPVWMTNHPPSVLWHCWLGHHTCKNRRPYNLYCVGAEVKPCSLNQSIAKFWGWQQLLLQLAILLVSRLQTLCCSVICSELFWHATVCSLCSILWASYGCWLTTCWLSWLSVVRRSQTHRRRTGSWMICWWEWHSMSRWVNYFLSTGVLVITYKQVSHLWTGELFTTDMNR